MRGIEVVPSIVLLCAVSQPVYAQQAVERNLQTCLSGKYPTLCDYRLLTPDQVRQARAAELRENVRICLTGKYRTLCDHSKLTPDQAVAVRAAERAENLRVCSTGKYPTLCRVELLSTEELAVVRAAERAENLRVCSTGKYPTLCRRSLLTPEQAKQVAAAEADASATRTFRPRATRSVCYESSIQSPTPFMGNHGEVFRLDDGSLWEVKYEYEYLYEYYPDVVICPSSGRLILGSKTLNVEQLAQVRSPSQLRSSTREVVESRIDGEFTGWEGETIFKLQNGEIWQQVSYAYTYHYAYSPGVLIYRSGSVHKLRVDGVEGEIVVRRIR